MTVSPTAAQRVAAWARQTNAPDDVLHAARLHALDAVGCALAARGVGEGDAVLALAAEEGGAPQAAAIGIPQRIPAATAALVNGTLAHTLDFDDTHDASVCHVSAVVVPAALAAGQAADAADDDVLRAIVAGNELVTRIGMAAPRAFHARGFHATSVCGVFGAALAAGLLRGLDADGLERALGLAGSLASGIFEFLEDGSPTKPLHAGWAAGAGVRAAALAAHGLRGPATVLEGRFGLFAAYTDGGHDLDAQLEDLGERWETPQIAFKAYPACHFIHGALDALASLGPFEGVVSVQATIAAAGAPLVCEPREDKLVPLTPYGARFSLPYALAAHTVHGRVDAASFTPQAIGDPAVLALTPQVHTATWAPGDEPSTFGGAVRVILTDGQTLEATAALPRGLDEAAVHAKAASNAALAGVTLDPSAPLTSLLAGT